MGSLTQLASSLLSAGPLLVVWVAMAGIGITRWQTHPRTSKLVVGAAGILLFAFVLGLILNLLIPEVMKRTGMGYSSMGMVYGAIGFVRSFLDAGAYALLIYAAYQGRQEYGEA